MRYGAETASLPPLLGLSEAMTTQYKQQQRTTSDDAQITSAV
jgi:hypothetical protein